MIWPFSKKKSHEIDQAHPMVLKDGETFFKFHCEFCEAKLSPKQGNFAIVLDAQKLFGVPTAVEVKPDGTQSAVIKVADHDRGFIVPAETASRGGDRLHPGDIVIWVPEVYNDSVGRAFNDPRSGWIGLIRAKVALDVSMNPNEAVRFLCEYK